MAAAGPYPGSFSNGRPTEGFTGQTGQQGIESGTLERLRAQAKEQIRLQQWHRPDVLLEEAAKSNIHVNTGIGFGRPDQAYIEWLKCEEYIKLLVQNPEFPSLNSDRRRRFVAVQRDHEEQKAKMKEVEIILKAPNANYSQNTNRQSAYANAFAPQGAAQRANRYTYSGDSVTRKALPDATSQGQAIQRFQQSQDAAGGTNGLVSRPASRAQDDPLMTRFSQLRSPTMRPQTNGAASANVGIPDSLRTAAPSPPAQVNGTNGALKPAGPREMPLNKELPATPPTLSVGVLLGNLPRVPSPIYTPVMPTQNPNITPPRMNAMFHAGGSSRPPKPKAPFPELSDPFSIHAEGLYDLLKSFKLLLLDVRSRQYFDEGHVHARQIVCVEPITLKPGQSLDQLEETLIYAPDDEAECFKRLQDYDLLVFYDQSTAGKDFLEGPPRPDRAPHMRHLFDSLTDFNYTQNLQRRPVFLKGGLDSWIDLVSSNALQTSNTVPKTVMQKPQRRKTMRSSIIGASSSHEVRARRLERSNPQLDADESRKWLEELEKERQAPADIRQFQRQTDGDSVSSQSENELFLTQSNYRPIQSVDDFIRRYPEIPQNKQSMTDRGSSAPLTSNMTFGPVSRPPPPPPQISPMAPPAAALPSIPSRPAPAASRPSYSGVSDHRSTLSASSQGAISKVKPPLYQSRSLAFTLKLPRTGLKNFGVTCYMNSTIQCLNATTSLSRFFLDETWRQFVKKNWKGSNGIMPEIFANLIRGLWRNETAAVRPSSFRAFCTRLNSEWGNSVQQDADEFLGFVLDILHEDFNENFNRTPIRALTEREEAIREEMGLRQINRVSKKEYELWSHVSRSYITELFAGQHASRLRCLECNSTSTKYEPFYTIKLEIPATGASDLRACLQRYCKEERISDGEEWDCPRCKGKRQATKQIIITRLPPILVISFKRFVYSAGGGGGGGGSSSSSASRKIHTPIDFPLHGLDMQPFMAPTYIEPRDGDFPDAAITPPFLYDCYAVMRHIGHTLNSGHYISLCRDAARACWRRYDDDAVADFDPAKLKPADRLQNQQAYIVFYERTTPR